jgi:LacI family transcriptional regulator
MAFTIKDVAKQVGLSSSTVSRALNKSGYTSVETQRRVEEAVALLGYQPNWMARGLRGKPSRLIGLIIPDISNTYYTEIAQGVSSRLRENDYEVILCVNGEDAKVDLHYLRILQQKRVDGILYAHPARGSNSGQVRRLAAMGIPIVEVGRQSERDLLDATLADNIQGAYQMVRHLISRGHRRIALIIGEANLVTGHDRIEGYQRAHMDAGIPVDPQLIRTGSFTRSHGEAAMRDLLTMPERPSAIFAGSNRILIGVLAVITNCELGIPEDISVVSFDDSEWLAIWRPPITAVGVAVGEMAKLAADLMLQQIRAPLEPHKPATHLLNAQLIIRSSSRDLTLAP